MPGELRTSWHKGLTFREREIIKLHYGLGYDCAYTLDEIGHIFKVTRERIRKIEQSALMKLRRRGVLPMQSTFTESSHILQGMTEKNP